MRAIHNSLIGLAILSLLAGCQGGGKTDGGKSSGPAPKLGAGQGDDQVLAVIDDDAITTGDFKQRMNRQSPYIRARYNTPQKKKEFLDNMVRFELQAREAARRGLDKHPDVIRTMKQVMIQKLTKEIFESKLKPDDISEVEIDQYYKDHERDYNKPEMVRASHIAFRFVDAKAKADARKKAKDALRKLKSSKDPAMAFSDMAKKLSEDPRTKNRGGDLGYFARAEDGGPQEKAVADAAFALGKVNDLSGIVEGKAAFHLLRLTAKRKAIEKTLEQVKPTIRSTLYRKKRKQMFQDFIEDLRGKANILIDEPLLGSLEIEGARAPTPRTGMPGRPAGHPPVPPPPGKPALKVTPAPAPGAKPPAPAAPSKPAVAPVKGAKAPALKAKKVATPPPAKTAP